MQHGSQAGRYAVNEGRAPGDIRKVGSLSVWTGAVITCLTGQTSQRARKRGMLDGLASASTDLFGDGAFFDWQADPGRPAAAMPGGAAPAPTLQPDGGTWQAAARAALSSPGTSHVVPDEMTRYLVDGRARPLPGMRASFFSGAGGAGFGGEAAGAIGSLSGLGQSGQGRGWIWHAARSDALPSELPSEEQFQMFGHDVPGGRPEARLKES